MLKHDATSLPANKFRGIPRKNTMIKNTAPSDLILSVKRSKFRIDDPAAEHSDSEFLKLRPEILERDGDSCFFCKFKSKKWQEVHHLDNDHSNNDLSNLVTVCPICHMVFHIGFAGQRQAGRLIYIDPSYGVTQADLNNLVRALWIHESANKLKMDSPSTAILGRLKQYSIVAHMLLSSSDPAILAEYMLSKMSDDEYDRRGEIFKGFLLLPQAPHFDKQIAYWRSEVFSPPKDWQAIALSTLGKWAENDMGDKSITSICKILERG